MKLGRQDYDRIQDPAMLIPKDEPVFLLRGQDKCAAPVVRFWANMAMNLGADPLIVRLAREQADRMENWRKHKIPDLLLKPDFSQGGKPVTDDEQRSQEEAERQEAERQPEQEQERPDRRTTLRRLSDQNVPGNELEETLVGILSKHCGERGNSEGAVETLNRIIRERDAYRQPRPDRGQTHHAPESPAEKGGV